jgi:hypothetical protein
MKKEMKFIKPINEIVNGKLKDMGFDVKMEKETPTFEVQATVKIDPKTLGMFAPVFSTIEVSVSTAVQESHAGINLHYSWAHPRGSNGYCLRLVFDRLANTWEDRS